MADNWWKKKEEEKDILLRQQQLRYEAEKEFEERLMECVKHELSKSKFELIHEFNAIEEERRTFRNVCVAVGVVICIGLLLIVNTL